MKLTHFGHACVALENEAGQRILIDPGSLAAPLTGDVAPGAVLVTHLHEDHLDISQLRRAIGTATVPVYGPADSVAVLDQAQVADTHVIAGGDALTVGGFDVRVHEAPHEVIYPGLPLPQNLALLVDGRLWHPGDSLRTPPGDVDVLLLPLGAPWLKLADIIDFVRAVSPHLVIPIHQGGLAQPHRQLHIGLLKKLAPEQTTVLTPEEGTPIDV